MENETNTVGVAGRAIPSPPGGGSWIFDEAAWQWTPNDSAPAQAPAPAGHDISNAITEQE